MKKKKLPEYEIIETIRQIPNPEKEVIQKAYLDLKKSFYKGVKPNGNNRPNL